MKVYFKFIFETKNTDIGEHNHQIIYNIGEYNH